MSGTFPVGTVVWLREAIPTLGLDKDMIGVCYETYTIGSKQGSSFIFPNGNYDGFSSEDQERFLRVAGFSLDCSTYDFRSVMALTNDFKRGRFDRVLKHLDFEVTDDVKPGDPPAGSRWNRLLAENE